MTTNFCPECDAELPPDAPRGLCPRCLLNVGLERGGSEAPGSRTGDHGGRFNAPQPSELGDVFPQFEVLELLGQGGMGAVYKARQRGLDRLVALKILPPEVGRDVAFAERFAREARALARLGHPNIVAVHDFGHAAGTYYYLVMEFVDGVNLRQGMHAGAIAPEAALTIVPQVCDALQYAHDAGVVHRDIKPENILLDRKGRIKIADFGLAKLLDQDGRDLTLTTPRQVMGTVHYMAPEQMESPLRVDHRADIYSLGVVFYELLTGQLPLGRFDPPSRKVHVDVRLDEVVLHALEREPRRRYQHASEVKSDLEAIADRAVSTSRSEPPAVQDATTAGAVPMILLCAVMMVFSLLVITAGFAALAWAVLTTAVGSNEFWGWFGGAFGCIVGGGGSLAGTWNTYRQIEGKLDLMAAPGWTWLDRVLGIYALSGLSCLIAALILVRWLNEATTYALFLIGSIVLFQGALFTGIRALVRRSVRQKTEASLQAKV